MENAQRLASGFAVAEGPVAMADGSTMLVEVAGQRLMRVAADGAVTKVADVPGGPNGGAVGPDGQLYLCNNGGYLYDKADDGSFIVLGAPADYNGGSIQRVDLATGEVTTLYTDYEGKRLEGPNDLVFDEAGGLWFTDCGKFYGDKVSFGAIYYARPNGGGLVLAKAGMLSPNGIGLSPDGRKLYVAETLSGRVICFDIEGEAGEGKLKGGPRDGYRSATVFPAPPWYEHFDSLAVEENGNVCVATLMRGGIAIYSPEGELEHIPVAGEQITNICFGGDDMRDAWITSINGLLLKVRWPRPGLKLAFDA